MPASDSDFADALQRFLRRILGSEAHCHSHQRLTGGASAETWALDVRTSGGECALILRRASAGSPTDKPISMDCEARIQECAGANGVLVPQILGVLQPEDGLGEGYLMQRLEGETLGHRIARDERFAAVRPALARQCAEQLSLLHGMDPGLFPQEIARSSFAEEVQRYQQLHLSFGEHLPVFDYAFRWLDERMPRDDLAAPVHGDFRNGNLMMHPERGLVAILDWELFHFGHPLEDLGWLCTGSWRFGNHHLEVGGFGGLDDLLEGYCSDLDLEVSAETLVFWMVWGSLRWGIICQKQARVHLDGVRASVEHAAIGRRVSETEIDLLTLMSS